MNRLYELSTTTLEQVAYEQKNIPIHMGKDILSDFPDRTINLHWHTEIEFDVVLDGEIETSIYSPGEGLHTTVLKPGDSIFVNSKALHKFRGLSRKSKLLYLVIPIHLFDVQYSGTALNTHVQPVLESNITWMKFDKAEESSVPITDTVLRFFSIDASIKGSDLESLEYLYRLWRLLINELNDPEYNIISRHALAKDTRMHLMLSYIYSNYSRQISIDDIASAAEISRSECFRIFSRIIKKTPVAFLTDYRLEKAIEYLTSTSMSVAEIATRCGFSSSSYFSKQFKKTYGVSPLEYRRKTV